MHDMWFASKIIVSLKEKIGEGKDYQTATVNIVLGPFTHVTAKSLRSAFAVLNEKEGLKHVVLNIRKDKAAIKCKKCLKVIEITGPVTSCSSCGADNLELINSEEFSIVSIQID